MSANLASILYLVSGVLFILALRGLSHPTTSRRGNLFGMIGMGIAVVTTVFLVFKLGSQLAERMDDMEGAEFLDTLHGLISMDYVVSNKLNIRTMEDVKRASFRINPACARELKEAVYPSRQKAATGRRRRRS